MKRNHIATISIFSGFCTQTMDALAKDAWGKLNPPLSEQTPTPVGYEKRSVCIYRMAPGLHQPHARIIAAGPKTNYIRLRGWCMIAPYCECIVPMRSYEFRRTNSYVYQGAYSCGETQFLFDSDYTKEL